jgi:hypothetical protein
MYESVLRIRIPILPKADLDPHQSKNPDKKQEPDLDLHQSQNSEAVEAHSEKSDLDPLIIHIKGKRGIWIRINVIRNTGTSTGTFMVGTMVGIRY